jgi:hypothetical protein
VREGERELLRVKETERNCENCGTSVDKFCAIELQYFLFKDLKLD